MNYAVCICDSGVNRRGDRFREGVLQASVAKFEAVPVHLHPYLDGNGRVIYDHWRESECDLPEHYFVKELIGVVREPWVSHDGALLASMSILPHCPLPPDALLGSGLSYHLDGRWRESDDPVTIIERISHVHGIDVVTNPAFPDGRILGPWAGPRMTEHLHRLDSLTRRYEVACEQYATWQALHDTERRLNTMFDRLEARLARR